MSYMKRLWEDEQGDLDQPAPMQAIRLQYVTTTRERELLVDTLDRLGLAHAWVGHQLYALNEVDSNSIRLQARAAFGNRKPDELALTRVLEEMLTEIVAANRMSVDQIAQDMRAQADEVLAARGVEIRANVAARIAEYDAA